MPCCHCHPHRHHPTVHHHHRPHRCSILHTMLGMAWWQGPVRHVGVAAWWWGPAHHVGVVGGWQWQGLAFHVGVAPWRGLCATGWQCWGLAFHVEVAPQQGLCVAGQRHGRPCMPCWDGVTAGLACGELASWVDLACSDGVAVVADLHVAKMEVARLACGEAEVAAGTCKA